MTRPDDNFFSFGQPGRRRWLRGTPSSASTVVSLEAKRRQNTSVGDPAAHRRLGGQGFPLMRSDGQTIRRLCRELVAVLGEIPAEATKPIRHRPGRARRAQGGSGAASSPRLAWRSSCAALRPGGRASATHGTGPATRSWARCARHSPHAIRSGSGQQTSYSAWLGDTIRA